jgi:hypothetical protein
MTKALAQGKMGYYAFGELVYMPPKREFHDVRKEEKIEAQHVKRNKARLLDMELIRRRNKTKFYHGLKIEKELTSRLERLKNASKQGNAEKALLSLHRTHELTTHPTKLIFYPDIEQRNALYYAAHTGHDHLVELYLSLYLIYTVKVSTKTESECRTYRQWFKYVDQTPGLYNARTFTIDDYDTCVLNALNEKVRHVMTKKVVGIRDAIRRIKNEPMWNEAFSFLLSMKNQEIRNIVVLNQKMKIEREKKNTRPPKLQYNHYDDIYDYDEDYDEDEDYNTYEEEYEYKHDQSQIESNGEEFNGDMSAANENESVPDYSIIENSELDSASNEGDSLSHRDLDYSCIGYSETKSDNGSVLSLPNDVDDNIDDLIVEWDVRLEDFDLCNEDYNDTQDEELIAIEEEEESGSQIWEVISDVKSVKSLDTLPSKASAVPMLSYKEMLLSKKKTALVASALDSNVATMANVVEGDEKEEEEEKNSGYDIGKDFDNKSALPNYDSEEEGFDAELHRDYYKFSRGGKADRVFGKGKKK